MPHKTPAQSFADHPLNWLGNHEPKKFSAVVMPDFFFDRFVEYPGDFGNFSHKAKEVISRKGGSIDNIDQVNFCGGNAANTTAALAALGADVRPIIETDKLGFTLLTHFLSPLKVNLDFVRTDGKTSVTTALEFQQDCTRVNLMLRDMGSLVDFGPKNLKARDFELLTTADIVCVFNWAGTRKHGTELAETVFRHVRTKGKGITYYDTADPTPNKEKIPSLLKRVLSKDFLDILSLNENEAIQYASFVDPKRVTMLRKKHKGIGKLALECAAMLAKCVRCRIDLHTTAFSSTFHGEKKLVTEATLPVEMLRATGAGDSWNAGNIYAEQQGMSDRARLLFANAVAGYYVSCRRPSHPTLGELKKFFKKWF